MIEGELYTRLIAHLDDTHCYPTYQYKHRGKLAEFSNYSLSAAAVELKTNQLANANWYRAIVDCGFKVAVAIPADVAKPPCRAVSLTA